MKKMKNNGEKEADRISDLPDELLYKILSSLDMKQVMDTSLLSKRWKCLWRHIWRHTSNLHFHPNYWPNNSTGFVNFVDKVLLRFGDSKIKKLGICDYNGEYKHDQKFCVQSLLLKPILSHVTTLELMSVLLYPVARSSTELVFELPLVENFVLHYPRYHCSLKNLVISAPRLEHLTVRNHDIFYRPNCNIEICAPKLTYLRLKGKSYEEYKLGKFVSLVTAEIDYLDLRDEKEMFPSCLNKVLKGLYNAKSLTLSVQNFEIFPEYPNILVPISLPNIKYLNLTGCTNGAILPVTVLLKSFPNVETLVFKSFLDYFEVERDGDYGAQFAVQCVFDHLKTIEIQSLKGCENELNLLVLMIKNAIVLENITLKSMKTFLRDEEKKKLIHFCKILQSISSSVTICLMSKRITGFTILFEESPSSSKTLLNKSEIC